MSTQVDNRTLKGPDFNPGRPMLTQRKNEMPPHLSIFIVGAILTAWMLIFVHIQLVRQGQLKGYNIATHFIATTAVACVPFIGLFVSPRWHGGAKILLIGGCFALTAIFGGLTHKLPASMKRRPWKKVIKRT